MTDYWLPEWWDCASCGFSCPECEIPPGLLAILCVRPAFGGGTEVAAGNMRGNTAITSQRQAQAARRQHGHQQVNAQLNRQQARKLRDAQSTRRR